MQTLVQDKLCPLRTTQWFLLLKKSEKTCSRLPEIPFFSNLQVSTLCQTLWNALEIPKKCFEFRTPPLWCSIDNNWLIHISPGLKPD